MMRGRSPGTGSNENLRSEEHTSELQAQSNLVCRLLLEKNKCHGGAAVADRDDTRIEENGRAGEATRIAGAVALRVGPASVIGVGLQLCDVGDAPRDDVQ